MPFFSETAGAGYALLSLSSGTGNWWGTLIGRNGTSYVPAPWISDANGGTNNPEPGIIWYWVR
jgi:hypothetical protein